MEETKRRLYVEPDGFWTEAAILFMVLAIVFRLIGSIGRWDDLHYLVTMVALPIFSGLLFLLCLLFFSKRAFWTTVIPVVFGVVFFAFLAMQAENEWVKIGSIAAYVVIVVLYTMAFSHPRLKWALAAALLLIFAGHVALKDLPVLMDLEHPVSFVEGMQEMSLLGIVLSLLCVSLAMKMPAKAAAEPAEEPRPAPVQQPAEEPRPAPVQQPAEEPKPEELRPPVEEKKPAGEKRFGWRKKAAKEDKPAEELPPAPVESKPTGELPPAEIWSAQPAPSWEQPAPEPAPEAIQTPPETVIMPEERPFSEPAQAYPLEETEEHRQDPSPDAASGEDA